MRYVYEAVEIINEANSDKTLAEKIPIIQKLLERFESQVIEMYEKEQKYMKERKSDGTE